MSVTGELLGGIVDDQAALLELIADHASRSRKTHLDSFMAMCASDQIIGRQVDIVEVVTGADGDKTPTLHQGRARYAKLEYNMWPRSILRIRLDDGKELIVFDNVMKESVRLDYGTSHNYFLYERDGNTYEYLVRIHS